MRETFRTALSLLMRTTRLTPGSTKTKPKGGALEALCTAFSSAAARGGTAPSTGGRRQTTTARTATERSWNAGRGRAKCRGLYSYHHYFSHNTAAGDLREQHHLHSAFPVTCWRTFPDFVEECLCVPVTLPLLVKILTLWWGKQNSKQGAALARHFLLLLSHWI